MTSWWLLHWESDLSSWWAGGSVTSWWLLHWESDLSSWWAGGSVTTWWLLHWESDLSSWWARICCWRLATALQSLAWVGRLGILVTVEIVVASKEAWSPAGG